MKIGTIGSGFIVDLFIKSARQVDDVEIVACYSRTEEKAKAYAEKMKIEKAYSDIDTMLEDEELDTIYVASPNSLHYSYSLKALNAKKNVICEKPFASNLYELDQLIEAMQNNHVMLWEAITNIYTPNLNAVKDKLNEIGDIRLVTCNYSQYSRKYQAYKDGEYPNVFTLEYSGGSLMDINIYNVHACMYLFGRPKKFTYYPNIGRNGIDTSGVLIFEYDHFIATLIGAKDCSSEDYISIQGDEGSLRIDDGTPGVCKRATFTKIDGTSELLNTHQNDLHMTYEIMAFEAMLKNQDFDTCNELLDYSHNVLEVIENARKDAGIYFDAD